MPFAVSRRRIKGGNAGLNGSVNGAGGLRIIDSDPHFFAGLPGAHENRGDFQVRHAQRAKLHRFLRVRDVKKIVPSLNSSIKSTDFSDYTNSSNHFKSDAKSTGFNSPRFAAARFTCIITLSVIFAISAVYYYDY